MRYRKSMVVRTSHGGKKVLAADFDGTLLQNDLAEQVLRRFARDGWEHYDELLADGKITLEECMRKQYSMIEAKSRAQVIEYAEKYCVFRPGVRRLLSICESRGTEFVVVSAGLDFCIRHAFKTNGIELPKLVCPKSFRRGKGFGVTFPRGLHPESSDFKEDLVLSYQGRGASVTFVGNGMGDLHAAMRADKTFAIRGSTLDRVCGKRAIAHERIEDFAPVCKSLLAPGMGTSR
jgi:2-hydroxy-3-keto-5-methylthiopentenyl-1-phosphate phosphatase